LGGAVEDLGGATEAAVEKAGGPATADVAGAAFRAGTGGTFGKELPDVITRLYNEVDKFVDPTVRTELGATRDAVWPGVRTTAHTACRRR
jgi:hypothetical protein